MTFCSYTQAYTRDHCPKWDWYIMENPLYCKKRPTHFENSNCFISCTHTQTFVRSYTHSHTHATIVRKDTYTLNPKHHKKRHIPCEIYNCFSVLHTHTLLSAPTHIHTHSLSLSLSWPLSKKALIPHTYTLSLSWPLSEKALIHSGKPLSIITRDLHIVKFSSFHSSCACTRTFVRPYTHTHTRYHCAKRHVYLMETPYSSRKSFFVLLHVHTNTCLLLDTRTHTHSS
jgi:hypothetical protein